MLILQSLYVRHKIEIVVCHGERPVLHLLSGKHQVTAYLREERFS